MEKISATPWTFDPINRVIYDRFLRYPIMTVCNGMFWRGNGILSTSAPDLQAALRELMARIDTLIAGAVLDEKLDLEPELTGARAALARAEGK